MATATQANALSTYYINKYEEKYGIKPLINRNKARWSWDNILQDLKPKEVKELIDYYFQSDSTRAHDLEVFFYNYDKILTAMKDAEVYRSERQRLFEESQKRAQEWKEKRESRTKGN